MKWRAPAGTPCRGCSATRRLVRWWASAPGALAHPRTNIRHAVDVPLREDWSAGGQAHLGRADWRLGLPRADGRRQRDLAQLRILQPGGTVGRGKPRRRAGRGSGDGPEVCGRGPRSATGARRGDDAPTVGEESAAHAEASRVSELSASGEAGGQVTLVGQADPVADQEGTPPADPD